MAEFKMFAAGITNGSHLNMRARDISIGWKNMFEIEQEPAKSIGSIWNIRSPSQRYNGYEAPVLSFTGIIDTSETPLGSQAGGSLFITVERLGSMSLVGSAYVLYPLIGNFLGSPFSNTFTGSVPVVVNTTNMTSNTQYMIGSEYLVNYNMQLTIVSGPV